MSGHRPHHQAHRNMRQEDLYRAEKGVRDFRDRYPEAARIMDQWKAGEISGEEADRLMAAAVKERK